MPTLNSFSPEEQKAAEEFIAREFVRWYHEEYGGMPFTRDAVINVKIDAQIDTNALLVAINKGAST